MANWPQFAASTSRYWSILNIGTQDINIISGRSKSSVVYIKYLEEQGLVGLKNGVVITRKAKLKEPTVFDK